jgi:hypothetical protein
MGLFRENGEHYTTEEVRWPDMPQIVNGVVVPPPAAVAV